MNSSQVRFMFNIIANRGAPGGRPAAASWLGAMRVSALPNSLRPREFARRRAGSMVHTNVLCCSTAAPRARLAAIVVFNASGTDADHHPALRQSFGDRGTPRRVGLAG